MPYFEACTTRTQTGTERNIVLVKGGMDFEPVDMGTKVVTYKTEYCAEGDTAKEAENKLNSLVEGKPGRPGKISIEKKNTFWEAVAKICINMGPQI